MSQSQRDPVDSLAHLAAEVERTRIAYQGAKDKLREAQREHSARRICCHCLKQVRTFHKWSHVYYEGFTAIAHRKCDDPESY